MARKAAPISMEHVILALLDRQPLHGYELHHRLSKLPGISKIWNIKQALFYAKLERLHADGYIQQHSILKDGLMPARVVFQLTPMGRTSLMTWITTPVCKARDVQQVFLSKLIIARGYGLSKTLELIHNQRIVCKSWLNHLEAEMPDENPENMDEFLVHTYKINRDQATLRWLDTLEAKLIAADKKTEFS